MGNDNNKSKSTMENKSQKDKLNFSTMKILPESVGLAIAVLVTGFAEVIFLAFVLALDVLPFKMLGLGLILLLAIDALIVFLANSKSKYGTRRIGCLVVIFIMLITLLGGDYYIYSTNDTLKKISSHKVTWEYYEVIGLKEGSYQKPKDLSRATINVADVTSKQLNEAKERLITMSDVTYEESLDIMAVGNKLVDSEGGLHDTLALMSKSEYSLLKDNIKGFGKNTCCIYKMKVRKRIDDSSKRVDVTKDSFNVLISGMDVWGTIDQQALSDVNMVMTVNPETKSILLVSIPRDSYIPLHSFGAKDKLTHSGVYGEEETKQTIEDFLGIEINYTIKVNFSMLRDVIDAIGGIDVENDVTFMSTPKGWIYKKGTIHMYGKRALYFARERKAFKEGDMKRNENQQKVLEATINRVTRSKVILTSYTKILNVVEDEMATDMTDKDLKKLAKMQLRDMHPWRIKKANITGSTGGAPCFSMGGQNLSCVFPDEETVQNAKEMIHDIMYPVDNIQKKKKHKDEEKNN